MNRQAMIVAEHADAGERAAVLQPEALAALVAAGLLTLKVPRVLGGTEAPLTAQFHAVRAMAVVDGSAAWVATFMGTAAALPAARLPDDGVAHIAGAAGWPRFAGTFPPSGRARAVPGGFRIDGRWGFASGIHHAQWVVAGCTVDGGPDLVWCAVPVQATTVLDTWDALGLRATGSCDYVVHDVFVPACCTFHVTGPPRRGGRLHHMPMHAILTPDHTAVTLGCARRALDEAARHAAGKVRLGSTAALGERGAFLRDLGRADTRLRAAEALVLDALHRLDAADEVDTATLLEARVAATHAAEVAVDVATFAYRAGGAHATDRAHPLGRAYRDTLTSTQHVHVIDDVYEQRARLMPRPEPA